MTGADKNTGRPLAGIEHLRQSVSDILTTPVGSRIMLREYGSRLFQLVDTPLNGEGLLLIYAAAAEALMRWEPRLVVKKIQAERGPDGGVEIGLSGIYVPARESITIEGVSIN